MKKFRNLAVGFVMIVPFFLGACLYLIAAAAESGYRVMEEKIDEWSNEP